MVTKRTKLDQVSTSLQKVQSEVALCSEAVDSLETALEAAEKAAASIPAPVKR